jgi:hypothetical protein
MQEMLRVGVTRLRLLLIAAAVAVAGGGWLRVDPQTLAALPSFDRPQTVDAATLVAALPLQLAAPLEPGLRLVALAASDIDDDGDLDLVASDGSLDLLVWINDGTGHMTRRYGRQASGWRHEPSNATSDTAQTTVSAVTPAGSFLEPGDAIALARNDDAGRRSIDARPDLRELPLGSQGPRAPPLSRLSI